MFSNQMFKTQKAKKAKQLKARDCLVKNRVLSWRLETSQDFEFLMLVGDEFHGAGEETEKERSP